jgi:sugar transferase (PEP-CTERM/EpsH1 system associated)
VKILIVVPRLPHPLERADGMTVYWMMKFLAPRHDIYLACFYDNEKQLEFLPELKKYCKSIELVKLKKWKAFLNMARTIFRRAVPLQVAYYRDAEMELAVKRLVDEYQPDIAYSQLIRSGEYIAHLPSIKKILAMQVAQTLNYRRMISNVRSPFYKILYTVEYEKVRRYEPAITREFDSCLLISKHDKESLDGHEDIHNIFYCPHGIDVAYYTPSGSVQKETAIVFSGIMEVPTNHDMVSYFLEDIYPMIKQRVPDVRFYIIGKNPAESIRRVAEKDPSIVVTGFVDDMRPFYERAKVGIDPLRIGAGMQNKLITGMCMGVPMVCSSIANEGIGAEHGKNVLIADDPENFADAVVEMLTDAEKARAIAEQAREFVEKFWTWEYHFERFEDHMESVVHGPSD